MAPVGVRAAAEVLRYAVVPTAVAEPAARSPENDAAAS